MTQDLMRHLVPHDQGQLIVIEAKTDHPPGQDDLPGGGERINTIAFSVHQDGIFRRQKLGINGREHFLVIPLN